jgi:hypothetical protein
MHIGYWWESRKERDHWEDQDVDGWTTLKWILQRHSILSDGMDWIDLAQDRDQWRALMNTEMNLRILYISGMFWSSCTIGSFSKRAQLHE